MFLSRSKKRRTLIALALLISAVMTSHLVQAITIDFDDLTYVPLDPEWPQFGDNPLTDEYASQGLLISGGFLLPYGEWSPDPLSQPNFLLGGNFLQLTFIGALPTFVSMYVSSGFDYANILHFYGPDGLLSRMVTSGSMSMEPNVPYIPNQYVSFSSPTGISHITLEGFFNMRTGTHVDDLTFEYAAVPEPASLALLFLGLLGLSAGQRRRTKRLCVNYKP